MTKLVIDERIRKSTIAPEVYGQFSEHLGRCIYEGLYVREDSKIPNVNGMRTDVVEALKAIDIPVLRWPGGCFADEYHWKDGIGAPSSRKKMINTHWGGVVEDNRFGTHEYMELCRQLGCKTYVNGNLGSGTVQEMSEWVEYMTFSGVSPMADLRAQNGHKEPWKVDYFGVGNENWGCGGNMTPEYYANEYRRYQTYVRNYDEEQPIYKVCCGANADDYDWTSGVLHTCFRHSVEKEHGYMDFLSLHYYVVPNEWEDKGSATKFNEQDWYKTLGKALLMDELIQKHTTLMDQYDPNRKIGLAVDEWGTWYNVEPGTNPGFLYQQNTLRDALVAGVTLNIFNKHSDRVRMACIAQVANVLQSMVLTEGEHMIKTPTYHVFHQFRHHQNATLLESKMLDVTEIQQGEQSIPQVTESVSKKDGIITITLCNLSASEECPMELEILGTDHCEVVEATVVKADCINAYNSFDKPDAVSESAYDGVTVDGTNLTFTLPAAAVLELRLS